MGCDRGQFLFFGDPPPAQCGQINARLNQLSGAIAAYERARADDGGQRQALSARYDAECRNPQFTQARAPRPRNFFEELFGLVSPDGAGLREIPVGPPDPDETLEPSDGRARGGPVAVCVRSCDGGFFPVSYSARSANLDDLASLCAALCPNAEVKLYTQSQWKGVELRALDRRPALFGPSQRVQIPEELRSLLRLQAAGPILGRGARRRRAHHRRTQRKGSGRHRRTGRAIVAPARAGRSAPQEAEGAGARPDRLWPSRRRLRRRLCTEPPACPKAQPPAPRSIGKSSGRTASSAGCGWSRRRFKERGAI